MIRQALWTGLRRSAIIDQQLWYLGRDIAGPFGNALIAYGFERRRAPGGRGSSAYLLPLVREGSPPGIASDSMLVCWGFAIYAGEVLADGAGGAAEHAVRGRAVPKQTAWAGVCIERFRDTPGLVRSPVASSLHQAADLPDTASPRTAAERVFAAAIVRRIALTLSAYERWALTTLGSAHRHAALRDAPRHKRHRFSHVPELSEIWDALALDPARSAMPPVALESDSDAA